MTLARIEPQDKTYRNKALVRLVPSDELLTEGNVWVRTHNSNHIEIDWTIGRTFAQLMGINCYRIYVHIYGTSKEHDHVIATDRDGVMVSPDQGSKPSSVKFVIGQNTVNYMHSPVKEEGESYHIEAVESWDSP